MEPEFYFNNVLNPVTVAPMSKIRDKSFGFKKHRNEKESFLKCRYTSFPQSHIINLFILLFINTNIKSNMLNLINKSNNNFFFFKIFLVSNFKMINWDNYHH